MNDVSDNQAKTANQGEARTGDLQRLRRGGIVEGQRPSVFQPNHPPRACKLMLPDATRVTNRDCRLRRTCQPLRPSSSEHPCQKARVMAFPEQLETERLLLRWPIEADAADIFARYASDPRSPSPHLGAPHVRRRHLGIPRSGRERRDPLQLARLPTAASCSDRSAASSTHIVQFGYCYARDAWGHGYATEAARALVPVWLSEPAVWRVQAFCDPENIASTRVWKRPG